MLVETFAVYSLIYSPRFQKGNTTGDTNGTETVYPSGSHDFATIEVRVALSLGLCALLSFVDHCLSFRHFFF